MQIFPVTTDQQKYLNNKIDYPKWSKIHTYAVTFLTFC